MWSSPRAGLQARKVLSLSIWNSTATKPFAAVLIAASLVIVAAVTVKLVLFKPSHLKRAVLPQEVSSPYGIPAETYIFRNRETHVHFSMYGGWIALTALINGKPMECLVDTGCPSILWNSQLHITSERTGLEASISDAGNNTMRVQEALLDRVQIGSLELRNVPSYAVAARRLAAGDRPILGNSVFLHTVLTIDYARQELIIQPLPINILSRIRYPRSVLDFQWINPDLRGKSGVPCFHAKVLSLPAAMTIDTGWIDNSVGLTRSFYSQLLPGLEAGHVKSHKTTTNFILGNARVITISRISSSFDGITLVCPATAGVALSPPAQAVLGYGFLKNYRTTIDYPQRKIWFEGIPADK